MSAVLKSGASLTEREERNIAKHMHAVEYHVYEIAKIINGKAKSKWLDYLCTSLNHRALHRLRSTLDQEWRHSSFSSPYYDEDPDQANCPIPTRKKQKEIL